MHLNLQDHRHGASVTHYVPFHSPSLWYSNKLYLLVTELNVCEQLASDTGLKLSAHRNKLK